MTWEQRWHPLREEWVIVAAHRNNRPWVGETVDGQARKVPPYVADCPLAPGTPGSAGCEIPTTPASSSSTTTCPVSGPRAPRRPAAPARDLPQPARGGDRPRGLLHAAARHDAGRARARPGCRALLAAWQEQYRDLGARPEVNHVLMFENKGEVVGVSNPHPHCQIYATNFVFKTIENEAAISQRYWDENRRC